MEGLVKSGLMLPLEFDDPGFFLNINTPEDLAAWSTP